MLVLTRRLGQAIQIGDDITITVEGIRARHVRIGIEAPDDYRIVRDDAANIEPRSDHGN